MAEFETSIIPLELVAKKFLSLDKEKAYHKASRCQLPFPTQRYGTQKSGRFVDINDLVSHIENERTKAKNEWKRLQ